MNPNSVILHRIRGLLILFMTGLILSGLTAFPLEWELDLLAGWLGAPPDSPPSDHTGLTRWIVTIRDALHNTYAQYPFMAYGTDWLAFAHIVIAIFFIGPLLDPIRNIWVIQAGMIACAMTVLFPFICGPIRGIPFFWQLIDCSFGLFGFIPLWLCRRYVSEPIAVASTPSIGETG